MRAFLRTARPLAVAAFVSVFVAACSDDDDPAGPAFNADAAGEVAEVSEAVVESIQGSAEVQANLTNVYFSLIGFGGATVSPMQPYTAMNRVASPFDAVRPMPVPTAPMGVLIPEELEGVTFVWNPDEFEYVPSEVAGAPENGIRFLWYAVDPSTGNIAEPLNALGHIDLIDASTGAKARLEVMAVRDAGSVTLADYFVEGGVTGNLVESVVTIDSEGFFSDGTDQLDFDMQWVVTADNDDGSGSEEFTVALDANGGSIDLHMLQSSDGDVSDTEGSFAVEGGGNEAVFEFSGSAVDDDDGTIDGSFTFNGEEVAVLSGDDDNPTFTQPDGDPLTSNELQALARIWAGFGLTFLFAFQALFPFLLVMGGAGL